MSALTALSDRERIMAGAARSFLAVLPPELTETVRAATILHWFDAPLLAALLALPLNEADRRYAALQEMPFVQAMGDRGHALHELTRRLLLDDLWAERPAHFRAWSRRAAETFDGQTDDTARIEAIYHWLVADPDRGADLVWDQGAKWYKTSRYNLVYALVQAGLEHDAGGRLAGRARGWIHYRKGLLHTIYSENQEALASLRIASEAAGNDRQLEACCLLGLGDVSLQQADYPAARAAYAAARPIYTAIDNRLGEAHCIDALGDVSLRQADYPAARAAYTAARLIYAAIGDHLGEANCIKALGDVHVRLAEYGQARQRYEAALPIYQAIGVRIGEANCIKRIGEIASELQDWTTAHSTYQEASALYHAIGDVWSEANTLVSLAQSHAWEKSYERAIEIFGEAIRVYSGEPEWYENRATTYLKLRNFAAAAADLAAAAELRPDHPYLPLRRGDLALKQGQYDSATGHYRQFVAQLPNMNSGHFGLGLALICLGQEAKGLAEVQRALELTYAPREIREFIEVLEELIAAQPGRSGLAEALTLARGWRPNPQP